MPQYTEAVEIIGSQDVTQLKVKGDDTQTAPLQSWQDSAGTEFARVTEDGRVQVGSFSGGGMATDESLVEGYRSETDSSKPKRGLHLKGALTDALNSIVTWVMQELTLKGTAGMSALHTGLRVKLRNENTVATGTMTGGELRAADVEVSNAGGASGANKSVPKMTGLRVGVVNEAAGYTDTAYGVKVEVSNAGVLGKVYALYTDLGIIHFGDVLELPVLSAPPSGNPDPNFLKTYVRLQNGLPQWYGKDSTGAERAMVGAIQPRRLTADLTVPDSCSLAVSSYFNIAAGVKLTLQGDADLEII